MPTAKAGFLHNCEKGLPQLPIRNNCHLYMEVRKGGRKGGREEDAQVDKIC